MSRKPQRNEPGLTEARPEQEGANLERTRADPSAAEQAVTQEQEALESGEERLRLASARPGTIQDSGL